MGSYTRILQKLQDLNIQKENLKEILYSSIDILIIFTELRNLDEFIEKWFKPIVRINAEEVLITETLTFIVISAGPSFTEEQFAYLFINTQPQNFETVYETLLTIPGVLSADTVFGPYDIICTVQAKDRTDLDQLIAHIKRNISGIKVSMTAVIKGRN